VAVKPPLLPALLLPVLLPLPPGACCSLLGG
jgi:hypothetical protein